MTNYFQIINRCRANDNMARQELYNNFAPKMLGICMRYVHDKYIAEDILHDSFIKVFERINQLKNPGALEGWMHRIFVNDCLKYLKNKPNNLNIDDYQPTEEQNNNEKTNAKQLISNADFSQDEILQVVGTLPDGFRTVFNLYVFENYSHKQISKTLGISTGTSKSQLLRARKQIQQKLYQLSVQKNKKNKKVYLSLIIMVNKNDLKYIDNIVKKKLTGFECLPSNSFAELIQSEIKSTLVSTTQISSKLFAIIYHKLTWIVATIIFSGILLFSASHSTKPNRNQIAPLQKLTIKPPIVSLIDTIDTRKVIKVGKITYPIVKKDTIKIKKVIIVKKKKYVVSQAKKTN